MIAVLSLGIRHCRSSGSGNPDNFARPAILFLRPTVGQTALALAAVGRSSGFPAGREDLTFPGVADFGSVLNPTHYEADAASDCAFLTCNSQLELLQDSRWEIS